MLDIDIDAVLHAQMLDGNAEGLTTEEWAEALGRPVYRVRKWLKIGCGNGSIVHGVAMRRTFNGKMNRFDVYRYVGQ